MENYTPFDELVIYSFMFIWLSFSCLIALIVDKLLWRKNNT